MAILNPAYWDIDGVPLATFAHGLETVDGLDGLPAKRIARSDMIQYKHGVRAHNDLWDQPKTLNLRIWVTPMDDDGAVTYTVSDAHLRENLDALMGVLSPRRGQMIDITRREYNTSSVLVNRTAQGRVVSAIPIVGTRKRLVQAAIELPYPRWHLGSQVVRSAASSHTFTPGGNASIADMVIDVAGAGTITHDETGDEVVTTGACVINVGRRYVGATSTTNDRRNRARFNRPWWFEWFPGEEVNMTISGTTAELRYYNAVH